MVEGNMSENMKKNYVGPIVNVFYRYGEGDHPLGI